MEKNKYKPVLRFKGFNDDWEQRKLEELADIVGGGTPSTSNNEYWNGDIEWYSPAELDGTVFVYNSERKITNLGLTKSSAKILPIGTVLFTSRAGIGKTAILGKESSTNQGFQSIVPKEELLNSYFIFSMTDILKRESEKLASGSTFLEISGKQMQKIKLLFPKDYLEQNKIGSFFEILDNDITLHQRKLKSLENKKKYLLGTMFPKKGSKVPEIRFGEFNDAWEQRKLGDVATVRTGYPFDSNEFNDMGEYLVITNGNVQNDSPTVDKSIGNRISINNSALNEYVLNKNDILVTMDGTVGRTAKVVDERQILAQRVGRLTANLDAEFLYQSLNTGDFFKKMTLISHGGTIKHISLSEIGGYLFFMPLSIKEQNKIGEFFSSLDNLITLHQRKLEKLEELKKYFLKKMFI